MIGARRALQEAYSVFLTTPENLDFSPPKPGYTPLKAKPRRIVRNRETGQITSTPDPKCHASETFTGRTSTNHRCAVLAWNAPIIAAAEKQSPVKMLWLRFAYDPYLDINSTAKNKIRAALITEIFSLWSFWPKRRQPDIGNPVRLVRLVDLVLCDTAIRIRTERESHINANEMARKLGFQSADHANWWRSWAHHVNDIYSVIDAVDREALQPIAAILHSREERQEAGRADSVW